MRTVQERGKGVGVWEGCRRGKGAGGREGCTASAFRIAYSELLPRSFLYVESSEILTRF